MVEPEEFRRLFGAFPTAVSIVTTLDADGEPRGFTCNALSAVSMDPPLLLVCVSRQSQTLSAMAASGAFGVHVLAEGAEDAAQVFAGKSARKFAALDWTPSMQANGVPLLGEVAVGYAECRTVQTVEAGDHWIFIGRVEGIRMFPRRPLVYHEREFSVWRGHGRELAAVA